MVIRKNISQILLGFVLLSTGCTEFIEPSIEKKAVVLLAPSHGIVTAEHPFYVLDRGWIKAKDLRVGFKLLSLSENIRNEIKSISIKKQRVNVYNLEVSGNNNYFVTKSKVLVHNKKITELNENIKIQKDKKQ